jgi:hypothetical protein
MINVMILLVGICAFYIGFHKSSGAGANMQKNLGVDPLLVLQKILFAEETQYCCKTNYLELKP